MEIQRADECDLPEILDLQKLAYRSEAELVGDFSIQPLTQTVEDIRREYERSLFWKAVYEQDGCIMGSVRACESEGIVHIGKLFVHPSCRKRGIGTSLLRTVEAHFPGKCYELFTSSKSLNNLRLYRKNGYEECRRECVSDDLDMIFLRKGS